MAQQLPLDELTTAIARIQGLLLTQEKVDDAVHLLAQAIKDAVPGTIGAGVSLLDSRGRRTSSGYTDSLVKQADAAQYETGQGPCLTAWAAEESVLIDDLADDARWPDWRRAVAELPIGSVVSAPLVAAKECVGALKLYAALPRTYDSSSARLLERFASPAATLLSHIQTSEAPLRMSERLQASLYSRDLVNRACGILMERHGLSYQAALQDLMRQALDRKTTLREASENTIAGMPAAGN